MLHRLLNGIACEHLSQENRQFEWLFHATPHFPVKAECVKILQEPGEFYEVLLELGKHAKQRVVLASLYVGNGPLERKLLENIQNNEAFSEGKLKVDVLIDFTRGSRSADNSRKVLLPLLKKSSKEVVVSLYHTPVLRGWFQRFAPPRFNEIFGLQHMKLYVFDDTLVISGANLSKDYFTNRQDRYFLIHDKRLCDFYSGLVARIQQFSLKLTAEDEVQFNNKAFGQKFKDNRRQYIKAAGEMIYDYLEASQKVENGLERNGFDTWVFPMVQMGQFGVDQEETITNRILAEAPPNSQLFIATGYFNLTSTYMRTLIQRTKALCNILIAHPSANGFMGAQGIAGGIPFAYSFLAEQFRKETIKSKQQDRIKLIEFARQGWTYHSKGLWFYAASSTKPCLTLIGSSNFGERSVKRDLETQLVIVTENVQLQANLHDECQRLYNRGAIAQTQRAVPHWIKLMVLLCRKFF